MFIYIVSFFQYLDRVSRILISELLFYFSLSL